MGLRARRRFCHRLPLIRAHSSMVDMLAYKKGIALDQGGHSKIPKPPLCPDSSPYSLLSPDLSVEGPHWRSVSPGCFAGTRHSNCRPSCPVSLFLSALAVAPGPYPAIIFGTRGRDRVAAMRPGGHGASNAIRRQPETPNGLIQSPPSERWVPTKAKERGRMRRNPSRVLGVGAIGRWEFEGKVMVGGSRIGLWELGK